MAGRDMAEFARRNTRGTGTGQGVGKKEFWIAHRGMRRKVMKTAFLDISTEWDLDSVTSIVAGCYECGHRKVFKVYAEARAYVDTHNMAHAGLRRPRRPLYDYQIEYPGYQPDEAAEARELRRDAVAEFVCDGNGYTVKEVADEFEDYAGRSIIRDDMTALKAEGRIILHKGYGWCAPGTPEPAKAEPKPKVYKPRVRAYKPRMCACGRNELRPKFRKCDECKTPNPAKVPATAQPQERYAAELAEVGKYAGGVTSRELAEVFGVDPKVMTRRLRRLKDAGAIQLHGYGVTSRYTLPGMDPKEGQMRIISVVAQHPEGIGTPALGRIFDVHADAMLQRLRPLLESGIIVSHGKAKATVYTLAGVRPETLEEKILSIVAGFPQGVSTVVVAAMFPDLHPKTVVNELSKLRVTGRLEDVGERNRRIHKIPA